MGELFVLAYDNVRGGLVLDSDFPVAESVALLRGELVPQGPVIYKRAQGRRATDLMRATVPHLKVISARTADAFSAVGIAGWRTYPVLATLDESPLDYAGLSVVGRCGPIRWASARLETRVSPAGVAYSAYFGLDPDLLGGDVPDIFMPPDETALILANERVVETVTQSGLTGFRFTALRDVEVPPDRMGERTPTNPVRHH